jgi:site-specific DNA-cytosine methylase
MNILQLCCFTNLWDSNHTVESIDLKFNRNVIDLPPDYGNFFDLVCAAPPCTQFTKANSQNWISFPADDIRIAEKCFDICRSTSLFWFLENPPGRIEKFIPALTPFRVLTWSGNVTNKEYVLYSNFLIMHQYCSRYGKNTIPRNKLIREAWQPDLVETIKHSFTLSAL